MYTELIRDKGTHVVTKEPSPKKYLDYQSIMQYYPVVDILKVKIFETQNK